jgi:hypothetical protein
MLCWPTALCAALVIGCACLVPVARADVDARAALSNLKVELIDLDLGDGIEPQITFIGPSDNFITVHASDARTAPFRDMDSASAPSLFADLETRAETPGALAVSRSDADSMLAEGSATGSRGESFRAEAFTWGETSQSYPFAFWLSAHTRLALSAQAEVNASAADRCDMACEYSFAEATIQSYGEVLVGEIDRLTAQVEGRGMGRPLLQDSGSRTLTVALYNDTEHAQRGNFSFNIRAQGAVVVVPEPRTCALMLVGLALLALPVARGRTRR